MIKIFVGNIPLDATEAELSDCFGQFGVVERAWVVTDRATRQSRGFAFVEMRHDRDGLLAIQELNGRDWDGRMIHVAPARQQAESLQAASSGKGAMKL